MASLRIQGLGRLTVGPVDLTVEAGCCVCLSGESGAGKSVLLRCVADLDPHEGRAWLGQEARESMTGPAWRTRVGLLPAESHWWAPTVGEHFEEPDHALLGELGFAEDVLGWSVARLSTGERQRLALGRLLSIQPQALLLDEPTASLDPANVERAELMLKRYRETHGAPVLWVSHDAAQIARVADQQLRIHDGKLVSP